MVMVFTINNYSTRENHSFDRENDNVVIDNFFTSQEL